MVRMILESRPLLGVACDPRFCGLMPKTMLYVLIARPDLDLRLGLDPRLWGPALSHSCNGFCLGQESTAPVTGVW